MKQNEITRRSFLRQSAALTAGIPLASIPGNKRSKASLSDKEARYYKKMSNRMVQCQLCPRYCVVPPGKRGHCTVRENRDGKYITLVYGRIAALHKDPIEKKPFFHFLPGTDAFSLATAGCNVDCKFCQNWELAQRRPEEIPNVEFTPEEVVDYAKKWKCPTIAFTYNEPTIYPEFILDTAYRAKEEGIHTVMISNGYINEKPHLDLCRVLSAYKVDLKSFNESYYREVVNGKLKPVLDTLVRIKSHGVWPEIVYLTVPTLNDNVKEVREMSKWILRELGPDVPLHFSRFYPKYKLRNLPPTPVPTIEKLRDAAMDEGLKYVYLGNVPGHPGENTYCPNCKKMVIGRLGYEIFENHIQNGKCEYCGESIPGYWENKS